MGFTEPERPDLTVPKLAARIRAGVTTARGNSPTRSPEHASVTMPRPTRSVHNRDAAGSRFLRDADEDEILEVGP
jgi:hypothetical protein